MPPGTGDVAISIAQLLPNSEILVVTTPQVAAAEVAERAGSIAAQTNQKVIGASKTCPSCPSPTARAWKSSARAAANPYPRA